VENRSLALLQWISIKENRERNLNFSGGLKEEKKEGDLILKKKLNNRLKLKKV
jgi:hypothetical protein